MRKVLFGTLVALCCVAAPQAARAGIIVEASLGKGGVVSPDRQWTQTNLMIAPGATLLGMLRLQLGFATDFADTEGSKTDFQLRPMVTIKPPLLPIHARAVFAVQDLRRDARIAYGGAAGLNFSILGIGVFAEAGLLPTSIMNRINWIIEGRVGASVAF
jgi:hypothetical protein